MTISTGELCEMAAELAEEHGGTACDYAWRAYLSFREEGEDERAEMWLSLSVLLEDIQALRFDPNMPLTIH